MFPSSSNNGNFNDPICYSDQQAYCRSFFGDINYHPNSKQEDPPFSFLHLPPSPFMVACELGLDDDHDVFFQQSHDLLLQHFHQQQQQPPLRASVNNTNIVSDGVVSMVDSGKNQVADFNKMICNNKKSSSSSHFSTTTTITTTTTQQIPRKRSTPKRDRHSKINTAQGPRDRRMRLSLKVARDFFNLQDKLGFDKPSKTVEWLLVRAKSDIDKLSGGGGCGHLPPVNYSSSLMGTKSASSTSDCEVVSGIDEAAAAIKGSNIATKGKPSTFSDNKKEKKIRRSLKIAFHPLARESRDKARARARERTKEKWLIRRTDEPKPSEGAATNHEFHQLGGCWSPFETGEESGTQSHNNNLNPSLEMEAVAEVEAPSSQEQEGMIDDDSLVIMDKLSPSSFFNYMHNNGVPLPQDQEHHFALTDNLQSFFKSWEACT